MADVQEPQFLHTYGDLLVQCWGNPALKKRLHANPEDVLKEFGLDPGKAKVTLKKPEISSADKGAAAAETNAKTQLRLWNEGKKTGQILLYFPDDPPAELVQSLELSDEELGSVAGGMIVQKTGSTTPTTAKGISSCCCTPCCCCT